MMARWRRRRVRRPLTNVPHCGARKRAWRCQGGRRDVFFVFPSVLSSRPSSCLFSSDGECLTSSPPLFLRPSSDTRLIASFRGTLLSTFVCANQLTAADSANQHRTSSTCQPACRGRKCRKIVFATNMCLIMNAGLQPDRIELAGLSWAAVRVRKDCVCSLIGPIGRYKR